MIWFGRHLHCNIGLDVRFPPIFSHWIWANEKYKRLVSFRPNWGRPG